MPVQIGTIEALFRYPVKSMRGERLDTIELGWHGLEGDRRLALRRHDATGGFPWLSASRLPELLLFTPERNGSGEGSLPSHIRTPDGKSLATFGEELAADIGCRHGASVQMTHLRHGIFDEAHVSVITSTTVGDIARLSAQQPEVRRFRPNILITSSRSVPFEEDDWVGGVLSFGDASDAPAIAVTMQDERCSMVNLHPDTALSSAEVLKAIVRAKDNKAGVYGTVVRCGRLAAGQAVYCEL